MTTVDIAFTWLNAEQCADLPLPVYATELASGMDVCAAIPAEDGPVMLEPGTVTLIPCGFAVAIPEGWELQIRPRSGLAMKHGITLINAPGTIDADYRGEIKIGLINLGKTSYAIHRGDRIAQMVLAPVARAVLYPVERLDETRRGTGGFGHTGVSARRGE